MIPGTDFHSRQTWQDPNMPVDGPLMHPLGIDTFALHYTAADDLIDGDPGESADDLPAYLRAIQRDYETKRGYSIGYNFAVDWLGGVWELRGFDYKCAANKGWNERTIAVLCLVDGADPLTAEALKSVRKILAESNIETGHALRVRPHSEIGATACPGDGIRSQLHLVTPWDGPSDPPTRPPKENAVEPTAIIRLAGTQAAYIQWAGFKTWIPDPDAYSVLRFVYPELSITDVPSSVLAAAGPIVGPLPDGVDGWGRPL